MSILGVRLTLQKQEIDRPVNNLFIFNIKQIRFMKINQSFCAFGSRALQRKMHCQLCSVGAS